ncbi:MAG: ATP-binding protein [Bradymonadia bacterium]|jgi:K+-sensing histidine kinase KdpD
MFFEPRESTIRAPQRSERQLGAAYRKLFVIASKCKTQRQLFEGVASLLTVLFGVSSSAAASLRGRALHFESVRGEVLHLLDSAYHLDEEQMERVLLSAKGQILNRSTVSEAFLLHARNPEFGELMIAPMILDGRPYGAIGVSSKTEGYFCEQDLECLSDLAEYIALLLEEHELEPRREALRHYDRLHSICSHFTDSLYTPLKQITEVLKAIGDSPANGGADNDSNEFVIYDSFIAEIKRQLSQLSMPMRKLEAFAAICSIDEETPELVNLHRIFEHLSDNLKGELFAALKMDIHLEENLPAVSAQYQRLYEAFLALLTNAAQAIERADICENHSIKVRAYTQPRKVMIEIADSGCGIDAADLKRVYDPFYSTCPNHQGLGLTQAKLTLLRLGGSLELQNKQPQGALAIVQIPYAHHHVQESVF